MDNFTKAVKKHNTSIRDLGEFDRWVNEATRADLNEYHKKGDYFGINQATGKMEIVKDLQDANNFSIQYVFKNKDQKNIKELFKKYKSNTEGKEWNKQLNRLTWTHLQSLDDLAVYCCYWV